MPGSFFVPSPAGSRAGDPDDDAGFDTLNDPGTNVNPANNAGAATTAEADAAYDYGDVAASVASHQPAGAPESGGMVFDAVLETSGSKKEGYYDERGEWIEGQFPGGFYDENGVFTRGYYDQAGAFHPGYVDANGEWVAAGDRPAGFYNEAGEWTHGPFPGVRRRGVGSVQARVLHRVGRVCGGFLRYKRELGQRAAAERADGRGRDWSNWELGGKVGRCGRGRDDRHSALMSEPAMPRIATSGGTR